MTFSNDEKQYLTHNLTPGPFGHFWYLNLDKVARLYYKAGSASFITFKVVADTAIFGPLHIGAFFSYMVLFEGGGWQVCAASIRYRCMDCMWLCACCFYI